MGRVSVRTRIGFCLAFASTVAAARGFGISQGSFQRVSLEPQEHGGGFAIEYRRAATRPFPERRILDLEKRVFTVEANSPKTAQSLPRCVEPADNRICLILKNFN